MRDWTTMVSVWFKVGRSQYKVEQGEGREGEGRERTVRGFDPGVGHDELDHAALGAFDNDADSVSGVAVAWLGDGGVAADDGVGCAAVVGGELDGDVTGWGREPVDLDRFPLDPINDALKERV